MGNLVFGFILLSLFSFYNVSVMLFISICDIVVMTCFSTGKAIGWTCDFVGSYHKYQATNCCFSEDSSLLAVSFEEIVTVWDSETWELKCTFCQRAGKIRWVN